MNQEEMSNMMGEDFEQGFDSEETGSSMWHRILASYSSGGASRLDYSVLSVSVITLGLIMMVEVVRHKIDHTAKGRPFFQAVLEGCYSELSTLGIVELCIWILLTYWETIDIKKEKVFAKVHFTLFYTAVLNAFQSVAVAVFACSIARRMWVEPESLELNHYVEIREEFDRVQAKMARYEKKDPKADSNSSTSSEDEPNKQSKSSSIFRDDGFSFSVQGFRQLGRGIWQRIKYPRLKRKYNQLLLQVRFHEMRLHFLESYNLPPTLKISDYLMRSQLQVLIHLVHVSMMAWLLLTAGINLLYFTMGITSYETEDIDIVGTILTWIFFFAMVIFVIVSVVVYAKMKWIFRQIMHDKSLWDPNENDKVRADLAEKQLSLFWFSDPNLVITAIQFMQFGYAVALSVVLIFYEVIADGDVPMEYFFIAIFGCYALFLAVVSQVIPWFTLCTSLGQLVNRKRLHETVAYFHLEEAKRERLEQIEFAKIEAMEQKEAETPKLKKSGSLNSIKSAASALLAAKKFKDPVEKKSSADSSAMIASLVKLDTDSLRSTLPESERLALDMRDYAKQSKKGKRTKTLSDGVTGMTRSKSTEDMENLKTAEQELEREAEDRKKQIADRRQRRERMKSKSDGVAAMAWNHTKRNPFPSTVKPVEEEKVMEAADVGLDLDGDVGMEVVDRPSASTMSQVLGDGDSVLSTGEQSDLDDVPEVDYNKEIVEYKPHKSIREKLRNYFLSDRYVVVSNVFGTMVAFYFVGQRVERFVHIIGFVPTDFISFDFDQSITFWLLTAWFGLFLCTATLIFWAIRPASGYEGRYERRAVVSAAVDVVITVVCVTVLMVAEAQRCCEDEDSTASRFLAGDDKYGDDKYGDDKYGDSKYGYSSVTYPEPPKCNCAPFGSRLWGGYGTIEPYTSLIALRVFRFWVAKRIVRYLDERRELYAEGDLRGKSMHGLNTDPFEVYDHDGGYDAHGHDANGHDAHGHDVHGHDVGHGHGHGHEHEEKGTIVELWESAISKYPDIVAKHGEFSAELLQAMLGIPPAPSPVGTGTHNAGPASVTSTGSIDEKEKQPSYTLPKKYASLTPHAQEIIVAGRLGRAVVADGPQTESSNDNLLFHLNTKTSLSTVEAASSFTAPNARLLRSMRRCDRKLLPMLDEWTVVDVVMTRYEMVYFEAVDEDKVRISTDMEDTRQAMMATKGGRGLRLCDVAVGRRVVGHLNLADVTSVLIERELPHQGEGRESTRDDFEPTEYWHQRSKTEVSSSTADSQWDKVTEDRVKIQTINGRTLFLRFYADLMEAELHLDTVPTSDEPIVKDTAFHWAQTIVRFCGPEQLKQALPHFGDATDDELRDFLVVHSHDGANRLSRRALTRGFRRGSDTNLSSRSIQNSPAKSTPLTSGRLTDSDEVALSGRVVDPTQVGDSEDETARQDDKDLFHVV